VYACMHFSTHFTFDTESAAHKLCAHGRRKRIMVTTYSNKKNPGRATSDDVKGGIIFSMIK
jgi:hypothetical protein